MKSHCNYIAVLALLGAAVCPALAAEPPFHVGCEAFTFHRFTVFEAIEKTAQAGGNLIEFFPGQRLSPQDKTGMSHNLTDTQLAALRAQLQKSGVAAVSYYTDIPKDEAAARKVFEFALKLGATSLSTESDEAIDTIEKLVKEFDLRVGFHQHVRDPAKPAYKLWDPHYVRELVKNRDRRIGACADTGHWASSGIVPMEAFKVLEGRIINVHLKDRAVIGKPDHDVIYGTGVSDIAGLLTELRRQKFDGNIFVEYEHKFEDNVADVKQCIEFVRDPGDYALTDPELKLVKIDSDPKESFLGLAVDGLGRIFAGGREALFVYEPGATGLYQPRRELYRFQKNAWIYDIVVRGRDLYVLTVGALYVFRDGVIKREGLQPERLMWGMPVAHVHQGLHGMTLGPDGDLYISQGDQLWYYGDFKQRPDHWGHWTIYHGPDNTPTPYTGAGGVLRLSPDGKQLAVLANGTRNDCGLAFDLHWNLFGNDNDHESGPAEYVPGRLLHITPHAYFNWPRGWMPEKQPWRSDLLDTMTPNLGRYVPVGMCYYNDDFLPEKFRHALYVARWGVRTLPRYPLRPAGDTFKTEEQPFLVGRNDARPVNVAVGRGGRLFAAICYMARNEESPVYRSDLVMITTAADAPRAPFRAFDPGPKLLDQALAQVKPDALKGLLPAGAPPGYGMDDLIYTLTYALAVSGHGGAAERVLIQHIDGGSELKRSIAMQALHNLGSPRGQEAIQKATQVREIGFLASTLLVQDQFPPLQELAAHWHDIPLAERSRETLAAEVEKAGDGCGPRSILAIFLAGYLPPASDPAQQRRELESLHRAATDLPLQGCYNGRMFGLRSYGLRTRGVPAVWATLAGRLETGWQRVLAVRIGFAHFPNEMVPSALDRLAVEPEQDVQWELLWATLCAGKGVAFRDSWDLWNLSPHRQFRLSFPGSFPRIAQPQVDRLLDWLESGRRPADNQVFDWLLCELGRSAVGADAFRLLRAYLARPAAERQAWVLMDLAEPAALPALRYLRDQTQDPANRESLSGGIETLESGGANGYTGKSPEICCKPTRECLLSQYEQQVFRQSKEPLQSEAELRDWIAKGLAARPEVKFLDTLQRVAEIRSSYGAKPFRFEHLYGCWRWVVPTR